MLVVSLWTTKLVLMRITNFEHRGITQILHFWSIKIPDTLSIIICSIVTFTFLLLFAVKCVLIFRQSNASSIVILIFSNHFVRVAFFVLFWLIKINCFVHFNGAEAPSKKIQSFRIYSPCVYLFFALFQNTIRLKHFALIL